MMIFKKMGLLLLCISFFLYSEVSPEDIRKSLLANSNVQRLKGEDFTWHAAYNAGVFYKGYMVYRDEQWIESAIKYFDFLISKMDREPDGYRGWVGPRLEDKNIWGSAIVGDANLLSLMLSIAEIILKEENLSIKFKKKAEEYINLGKEIIEKWDKRGCWYEQLGYGKYLVQTKFILPSQPDQWIIREDYQISENLNKSGKMGVVCIKLYRILNDNFYRDRAVKIFSYYKSIMRYIEKEDRYVWNFWEPFAVCDMTSIPKSWVDVHPQRAGYQAAEVSFFVEAYHTGIVFDEKDIKRIINTNLWMWNNSFENPQFKSANGKTNAGTLWSSLSDFDQTIRKLNEIILENQKGNIGVVERDYFKNVICKEPPSFKRKYVKDERDIIIPEIPIYNNEDITMGVVIPMVFNDWTKISCKIEKDGKLEIYLYSKDGKMIEKIFDESVKSGFKTIRWDGKNSKTGEKYKGEYKIRFVFRNSLREVPIKIGG
ncbi:MAG: hypothetical protein NC827_07625 [Candidatus Omnitrophica bacterium]|nr:hypothetical protein [Candidatus Omnitrophota bacterium]